MRSYFTIKQTVCLALSVCLLTASTGCKKNDVIPDAITTFPAPTVINAAPNSGVVGTEVTLTGTNFSTVATENVVKFNGTAAVVKSATSSQLVVTAPTDGTSGLITVKVKDKDAISIVSFAYGIFPTLTSISPSTAKPGDRVTITGTNFSTVLTENRVSFHTNGAAAAEAVMVSASATQLVVEVPAAAVTGNVTIVSKLAATNLLTITITPVSQGSNISLFAPQSSNGIERFVVDARSNFYAVYNIGAFSVAGADGVVKKTFTKADFANHPGNIVGLGKDVNGNACVAWNRYSGSKSFTTFFRIKADFSAEKIGDEVAPSQSSITMTRPFVVDAKGDVYYTDTFSVFKVENSTIDLGKRYIDGRPFPASPYISDIQIDAAGNLYVLTKGQISATENSQSIVKYDGNKNATTLFTVQTTTIPTSSVASVPATTVGEFKSFVRTPEGDIYVGDFSGNRIRKITGNNTTEVVAGSGEYGRLYVGYELTGPKLSTPVPRPLFIEYDAVKKLIYSSPYTYDKGSFVQVFAL